VITIPTKETLSVFRAPTTSAREYVSAAEYGISVQKAPTGGDGLPFEVQQGVVYEIVGEQPHQAKYANLVNDGALPGIKPEGNFFRRAAVQYVVMCVRHAHAPAGN